MYIPNWGEELLTGNERIDGEHRILFEQLDQFITAINRNAEARILQDTLNYLILYTRNHFAAEELMHRNSEAPGLQEHIRAHADIASELESVLRIYREEGVGPHLELRLINGVMRRIVDQVHEHDIKLARYIRDKHLEW